jgi:hypothetical protein
MIFILKKFDFYNKIINFISFFQLTHILSARSAKNGSPKQHWTSHHLQERNTKKPMQILS